MYSLENKSIIWHSSERGFDADDFDADSYSTQSRELFKQWVRNNLGDFSQEIAEYNPAYDNLDVFVAEINFPSFVGPGLFFDEVNTEIEWMVIWTSPASALDGPIAQGRFTNNNVDVPSGSRSVTGVIDTNATSFRVDAYTPPTGSTNPHSHFMTLSPVEDPNTDFSGETLLVLV